MTRRRRAAHCAALLLFLLPTVVLLLTTAGHSVVASTAAEMNSKNATTTILTLSDFFPDVDETAFFRDLYQRETIVSSGNKHPFPSSTLKGLADAVSNVTALCTAFENQPVKNGGFQAGSWRPHVCLSMGTRTLSRSLSHSHSHIRSHARLLSPFLSVPLCLSVSVSLTPSPSPSLHPLSPPSLPFSIATGQGAGRDETSVVVPAHEQRAGRGRGCSGQV